jgi:16S rRNA (cytidine1402-2'-O)-methyltransferase
MIPGPSALIMALVLSGLPLHSFTFRGFPPRKSAARQRFFAVDQGAPHTLIYYESPYRLADCLRDAIEVFGDRRAALANDLTKMFESVQRGPLSALLAGLGDTEPKGEYTLVIAGTESKRKQDDEPEDEISSP